MARVFITGSSDGLGLMAARLLHEQGHAVVLHARDAARAADTHRALPGADAVLTGDLSSLAETRALAEAADTAGPYDAVIHNAAVGYREKRRLLTADGLAHVFAVNSLAPYVLAASMARPKRLVFVSSELHRRGTHHVNDLNWERRAWNGTQAYSDTKLHNVLLAMAAARLWPDTLVNSLEPGWVATKMGGPRATGDLDQAHRTQVWLATGADATTSGGYFFHCRPKQPSRIVFDRAIQDALLDAYAKLAGVQLTPG